MKALNVAIYRETGKRIHVCVQKRMSLRQRNLPESQILEVAPVQEVNRSERMEVEMVKTRRYRDSDELCPVTNLFKIVCFVELSIITAICIYIFAMVIQPVKTPLKNAVNNLEAMTDDGKFLSGDIRAKYTEYSVTSNKLTTLVTGNSTLTFIDGISNIIRDSADILKNTNATAIFERAVEMEDKLRSFIDAFRNQPAIEFSIKNPAANGD